jgi:Tfp pilus assembly protein PilF/TolB-like protein
MPPDADRLLALAEAISDGREVDWAETESATEDLDERALVQHLRLVAGVANVHRSDHPEPSAGPTLTSWGSLSIVERVGVGSFGSVYKAWDPRLTRDVALKLLHRDASGEAASQLLAEGRRLARVRHPHVISIYGADQIDGRAGIWMELIEGRTLEQILKTDGPFGPREAALIGIDLCGALAAVHAQGLVHRDIKAQNVMREDGGRLVLMDFGAGLEQTARPDTRAVGTPAYMAPEILRGSGASRATDIYSLGVLLFRLVTAQYPFSGASVESLQRAHEQGRRLRLSDARPDLPSPFVEIVERAIASDPAARFESAGAMQAALSEYVVVREAEPKPGTRSSTRAGMAVAALVIAALVLAAVWWSNRVAVAPADGVWTMAVRPLRDLNPDPAQRYFAAALTDVLLAQLGSTRGFSAVELTDEGAEKAMLSKIAVDGILDASLLREKGQLRLTARVVKAGTGAVVWGNVYERDEREAFTLLGQLAMDLARDLHLPLNGIEPRGRQYVVQPAAQDSYLRGKYLLDSFTRQNLLQARTEFERAIQLEPTFAPAHASLALTYLALGSMGVLTPQQVLELAPPAANTALSLDATHAESALAAADVRFRLLWDWTGAEEAYRHAIDLNPSYVEAHGQYARFLAAAGRTADAMRAAREGYRLDPLSMDLHGVVGIMLYYDRRFEEAVTHFRSRIEDPSPRSHVGLGRAASAAGQHTEAIASLQRAVDLSGGDPSIQAELARATAASGDVAGATRLLRELEARRADAQGYVAPQDLAYIYVALGQIEVAFDLLNRAVDEHAARLLWISVDPRLDAIRTDPRFGTLLNRLRSPASQHRSR